MDMHRLARRTLIRIEEKIGNRANEKLGAFCFESYSALRAGIPVASDRTSASGKIPL
jgi:hypothetical protein